MYENVPRAHISTTIIGALHSYDAKHHPSPRTCPLTSLGMMLFPAIIVLLLLLLLAPRFGACSAATAPDQAKPFIEECSLPKSCPRNKQQTLIRTHLQFIERAAI